MSVTLNPRILQKRDTWENWETKNPVLLEGEVGYITNGEYAEMSKIGDGVTNFLDLPFTSSIANGGNADTINGYGTEDFLNLKIEDEQVIQGDVTIKGDFRIDGNLDLPISLKTSSSVENGVASPGITVDLSEGTSNSAKTEITNDTVKWSNENGRFVSIYANLNTPEIYFNSSLEIPEIEGDEDSPILAGTILSGVLTPPGASLDMVATVGYVQEALNGIVNEDYIEENFLKLNNTDEMPQLVKGNVIFDRLSVKESIDGTIYWPFELSYTYTETGEDTYYTFGISSYVDRFHENETDYTDFYILKFGSWQDSPRDSKPVILSGIDQPIHEKDAVNLEYLQNNYATISSSSFSGSTTINQSEDGNSFGLYFSPEYNGASPEIILGALNESGQDRTVKLDVDLENGSLSIKNSSDALTNIQAADPTIDSDVATKKYVDEHTPSITGYLSLTDTNAQTVAGPITFNGNVALPANTSISGQTPATKVYVDQLVTPMFKNKITVQSSSWSTSGIPSDFSAEGYQYKYTTNVYTSTVPTGSKTPTSEDYYIYVTTDSNNVAETKAWSQSNSMCTMAVSNSTSGSNINVTVSVTIYTKKQITRAISLFFEVHDYFKQS